MPTYRTTVGPNGQIVLPSDLIKRFEICEGAEVEFFLTIDGDVFFRSITGRAKNWKDMISIEVLPQLFPPEQ